MTTATPKWRWSVRHLHNLPEDIFSDDDVFGPSDLMTAAATLTDDGGLVHHIRIASIQSVTRSQASYEEEPQVTMEIPEWAWYINFLYGQSNRIPSNQGTLRESDLLPEAFVITDNEGLDHHIRYAAVQGVVRAPGTRRERDPSMVTDNEGE